MTSAGLYVLFRNEYLPRPLGARGALLAFRRHRRYPPAHNWRVLDGSLRICEYEPCSLPYKPNRGEQRFCTRGCAARKRCSP